MKSGERAERIDADYLQQKGPALIESHYRCRWGEIDLILRDRDTLVFAEVRLRQSKTFGGAAYSVDRRKQARIIATARHYLASAKDAARRFDVVLLERLSRRASNGYATRSQREAVE
jgi:putative endonuclease